MKHPCTLLVSLRANSVKDNANGTITIEVPTEELPQEVMKVLDEYFVHTGHLISQALGTEALIGAQVSEAESKSVPPGGLKYLKSPEW